MVEDRLLDDRDQVSEVRRHVLRVRDQVAHVADDRRSLLLGIRRALLEAALHDGDEERERRRVHRVHERRLDHHLQRLGGFVGVGERLKEQRRDREDLGVLDHVPDVAQRRDRPLTHLGVGVGHGVRHDWHDRWEARAELARRAVGHRAQQVDRGRLGTPRPVLHALEQRGHDELHALPRELGHHGARRVLGRLAHPLVRVAARVEQDRQDVDDVGFEEAPEALREQLEAEQRTLAARDVLLVGRRLLERRHDVVRLEC
mmetsp:Transcript_21110/g.50934  ORF Transcript_21110/g.50934 Transcript_21110/m.50934 type:complete len:259 (-) Transcript_21110:3618-4394(-)